MGLFDSVTSILEGPLGQFVESEAAAVLPQALQAANLGGLQGVVNQLQQAGMGNHVQAWVNGTEKPQLTPDMLQSALGSQQLQQLAQHYGVDVSQVGGLLAQFLPGAVAAAAQNGQIKTQG